MITQISYNVLIERFKAFAAAHFLIKGFSHGDLSNIDIEKEVEFPWMHVLPVEVEPRAGSRLYSFVIIFADLPRDKETPAEYQRECISDCIKLAEDLLAEVQNGQVVFGPYVELDGAANIEVFINEFSHTLVGVNLQLTLSVPWDWSACDIPADFTIGGSGSGGTGSGVGITLQTNGVNNGLQSLLNLQQGTNVTLVDNGNGTVTINSTGGGGGGGGTVTSVALTVPSAFVVSGSPITTAGTLAITGAGTSSDYIDGAGDLQAFPFIPTQLDDLSDVYISSPADGETLLYNSVGGEWKNQPLATVATSGDYNDLSNLPSIPANLDDLNDVNAPAPTNGQVLAFNSISGDWEAITPASGGSVTSVALTMPAPLNPAFTVGGSPVTTAGTLAVTANGSSAQYIDGTGALQSFPALSGFVPYTGATQDVDLDANKLSAESIYIEGTNGAGHLHLKHQNADATASGQSTALWADNNGDIKWKNDGNYKTTLKSSSNTADHVYTLPNETAELMPRNAAITGATKTKITYDADGLVTAGADLAASDMPTGIDATKIGAGTVSDTEFGYLDGVTSSIQTQINNKKDTITYGQVYATTVGLSSTVYAAITGLTTFNATESNRHFAVPVAGIVKNFYLKMSGTQSATGTLVITIRNNATSSAVTVTVANADGASPTKSDNVNTLTVAAGDLIAIQLVNNATVTSASILSMAFIIERT